MMGAEGLESFKAGLRMQESGSFEGNYEYRGRWRDGDGEVGAYGILNSNFQAWASEAGLSGADWRDPDVQDLVVTKKLSEYWEEFRDWRLVAFAWMGGPEFARTVQADPQAAAAKHEGKPVSGLIDSVMANMKASPKEYGAESDEMPYTPENPPKRKPPSRRGVVDAKTQLVELFSSWGDDLAGGKRVDYRTVANDMPDEPLIDEPSPDGTVSKQAAPSTEVTDGK